MSEVPEIADLNQLKDILKRKSGVGGAVTASREGRFFEWFIVIGPPPKPLESFKPLQQSQTNSSPATSAKAPAPAKYSNTLSPTDINPNYSSSPSSSPRNATPLSRGHSEPAIATTSAALLNLSHSDSDLDKKNGDNEEPQIIFKFPPDKEIPVEVVPFCWTPSEKKKKPVNIQSKLNNAIYGQLSMLEKAKNSFLFLLIHDKDVYYGICVNNKEILHRYPSFARTTQPRQQIDVNSPLVRPVNRVYCFISRFPFFKLHYNVLYSILARERLYLLEEASAGIQTPSHQIQLDDNNENEILSLLKSYYSKDVPKAGSSLSFKLPGELHSLDFKCPEAEEDQLVADWCLPIMFKAIQCDTILTLLAAAITEKLIVFVCPNRGILSALVLAMIPVLRPLIWQGPLIPILPRHMYEYLQAPVPYIVGVLDLPQDIEAELTNALIVRVDASSESVKPPSGGITMLPEHSKLQSTLKHYSAQLFKPDQRFPDPYKIKKEEVEMAAKIMTELQNFNIENVLEVLRPHIKPGILQIMDKAKFLNSVPKKHRPFFSIFIETQQFAEFMQHFAQAKSEQEETTQVVLAQMEEKIQGLEKLKREYFEKMHECEEQITYLRQNQHALLSQQNPSKSNGLIKASIQHLTRSLPKEKKGEQK